MKEIKVIRCSGLSRAMTCTGSLFIDALQTEAGFPAKEGTAAGEWLRKLLDPAFAAATPFDAASNGIRYDEDMKFYTLPIANEILSNHQDGVLCEQSIDWRTRSGIIIKGQYDASFVREGSLYIDDLKYGWGIVDVEENWQLLGYAIGEVIRREVSFDRIVLRIHQPRPHHESGTTREWVISYQQLLAFKEQIEVRCEQIAAGQSELVTSEKCKYCPAAASNCPAFNRAFFAGVDVVMGDWQADTLNEAEIAFQLKLLTRIGEVFKIKFDSIKDLAIARIKENKVIPGYMIQESHGHRQWKAGISPKVIEVMTGVNIIEEKMMTPAKAEKMGVAKALVKDFTVAPFIGMDLVPKDAAALATKIFGKGS